MDYINDYLNADNFNMYTCIIMNHFIRRVINRFLQNVNLAQYKMAGIIMFDFNSFAHDWNTAHDLDGYGTVRRWSPICPTHGANVVVTIHLCRTHSDYYVSISITWKKESPCMKRKSCLYQILSIS